MTVFASEVSLKNPETVRIFVKPHFNDKYWSIKSLHLVVKCYLYVLSLIEKELKEQFTS